MNHELAIQVLKNFLIGQRSQLSTARRNANIAVNNPNVARIRLKAIETLEKGISEVEQTIKYLEQ